MESNNERLFWVIDGSDYGCAVIATSDAEARAKARVELGWSDDPDLKEESMVVTDSSTDERLAYWLDFVRRAVADERARIEGDVAQAVEQAVALERERARDALGKAVREAANAERFVTMMIGVEILHEKAVDDPFASGRRSAAKQIVEEARDRIKQSDLVSMAAVNGKDLGAERAIDVGAGLMHGLKRGREAERERCVNLIRLELDALQDHAAFPFAAKLQSLIVQIEARPEAPATPQSGPSDDVDVFPFGFTLDMVGVRSIDDAVELLRRYEADFLARTQTVRDSAIFGLASVIETRGLGKNVRAAIHARVPGWPSTPN